MKLVFTGTKKIDDIVTESEIPLQGMEIAVPLKESRVGVCSPNGEIGKPKFDEELDELVVALDPGYQVVGSQGHYTFGSFLLVKAVTEMLKDPQQVAEGLLVDRAALTEGKVGHALFPSTPRVSRKHFTLFKKEGSIYVADAGSYTGTWVDGKKIGADYDSWPHWDIISTDGLAKLTPYPKNFSVIDSTKDSGEASRLLYRNQVSEATQKMKRVMNWGVVEVREGSEITLGKNAFGEDYKFILRVD
jgi:hypothetical protein